MFFICNHTDSTYIMTHIMQLKPTGLFFQCLATSVSG